MPSHMHVNPLDLNTLFLLVSKDRMPTQIKAIWSSFLIWVRKRSGIHGTQ